MNVFPCFTIILISTDDVFIKRALKRRNTRVLAHHYFYRTNYLIHRRARSPLRAVSINAQQQVNVIGHNDTRINGYSVITQRNTI